MEKTSFQEPLPDDPAVDKESQPLPTIKPDYDAIPTPSQQPLPTDHHLKPPPTADDPFVKSSGGGIDDPMGGASKRSLASTPEPMEHNSQGESIEGDMMTSSPASSAEIDAITECLEELTEMLHTAAFTIVSYSRTFYFRRNRTEFYFWKITQNFTSGKLHRILLSENCTEFYFQKITQNSTFSKLHKILFSKKIFYCFCPIEINRSIRRFADDN